MKLLRTYKNTTSYCSDCLDSWKVSFREEITRKIKHPLVNPERGNEQLEDKPPEFSHDSYLDIYKDYESYKAKAQVLQKIANIKHRFPINNYQLQCFILTSFFQSNREFDLPSVLAAIHPITNFSQYTHPTEEAEKIQKAILYGWLATENY